MKPLPNRDALRALTVGQRVRYHGWRGDDGEGVFAGFVWAAAAAPPSAFPTWERNTIQGMREWGLSTQDAVLVRRDHDAGGARLFMPLLGDGETVEAIP